MNSSRLPRLAITGLSGISLAVVLAGCSPAAEQAPADPAPSPSSDSGGSTGAVDSSAGRYADGDYSATGEYQSPGGSESIEVDLTLEGDTVTDVTVTPNATDGNAARYQDQFAEGIAAEVVGKSIDDLAVDRVAGSSLTSGGFNDALEQIKADAAA